MSTAFSFGTDPEFMLHKDGVYKSAIGVIPGTKYKRHKIGQSSFYYDNVMAECTVQPASNKEEVLKNIKATLGLFANLSKPYRLKAQASQNYPETELTHKDALAIGCDREYCAYALREIEPPEDDFVKGTLRSAGGHIHTGLKHAQDQLGCLAVIRAMDLFMGIPSVFLDKDKTSKARKALYGKAGRFRKPPHGAEYRSMSNFWLASPELTELTYDLTQAAVDYVVDGGYAQHWSIDEKRLLDEKSWEEDDFDPADCHVCNGYDVRKLRAAIDNMDKKLAKPFLEILKPFVADKVFHNLEKLSALKEQPDFYEAWKL